MESSGVYKYNLGKSIINEVASSLTNKLKCYY